MNQRGEEKGMEGGGGGGEDEEKVLVFMDSLDSYLTLLDSLSSTLRQGWLELASARHSMGSSRISSVLFDLKEKSASTTLQVTESIDDGITSEPHYTLPKWGSLREEKRSVETDVGKLQMDSYTSELRHRGSSQPPEIVEETYKTAEVSHISGDNNVQRERAKSLSVFGTLVSPKLRSAQVSFETALETIVEIANMRSSMLSTFSQLQQKGEVLGLKS